jgi:lysozyme
MTGAYLPAVMTPGILDVSHWDAGHDYVAAKASGVVAVIAKATQGQGVDPMWAANAQAVRDAGLFLGAYEFLDDSDPVAQADKLIATVNDPSAPLFLDAERNPSSQASLSTVAGVATRIRMRLGYWPGLYMGRDGPDGSGTGLPNIVLANCPLWLPEYGTSPICPPGWSAWKLWQYTDGTGQAQVPGIGQCDQSRFAGSLDELKAWWASLTNVTAKPARPAAPTNIGGSGGGSTSISGAGLPSTIIVAGGSGAAGGGLPRDRVKALVISLQQELTQAGLYKGPVDGDPGPQTQAALSAWR